MGNRKKPKSARAKKREARRLKKKSFHRSVIRPSYNTVLYEARLKAGLRRFPFAKALGIFPLLYPFLESGYIKPTPKQILKISAYLGEDYQSYCEGISSYPQELPEKPRNAFVRGFFDLLGSTPFRLLLVLLLIGCLGSIAYGMREEEMLSEEEYLYYPEELHLLREGVIQKGSLTLYFDPESPLDLDLFYLEITKKEDDKFLSVKCDREEAAFSQVEFLYREWTADGRINLRRTLSESPEELSLSFTDYATSQTFQCTAVQKEDGSYEAGDFIPSFFVEVDEEKNEELLAILEPRAAVFDAEIEKLIEEKLGISLNLMSLCEEVSEAEDRISALSTRHILFLAGGFVAGLLVLFCLMYCLLYGTKNGEGGQIHPRGNLVHYARRAEPATDLKIPPFLPETALSLFGSYLLYRSSLRFIYLAISFSFTALMDVDTAMVQNQSLMQLFYVAMFLLYFLDFDSFMDDRRVQGRIIMYFLLYVALYTAEVLLITGFADSPSLVYQFLAQLRLPNMFGSICCYFIIMHFLFFTPKRITNRRRLIWYRLCSLIPVLIILGSKVIFNGAERFFGWDLPLPVKYLFNGERITFSLLCIGYLFGLYFLRLHFEKRYGTENAHKYFNGNRFLWQKNIMSCLLVLLIALLSYLLKDNAIASVLGVGESQTLLLLIPLLLFYHPHKGPRNRLVDFITMGAYLAALCYGYVIGGIVLLLGIIAT